MSQGRTILTAKRLELTLDRLCFRILEKHPSLENTVLLGIQPRGVPLADMISQRLMDISGVDNIPYGKLDITFYVLYTGRTIHAAMSALQDFGRPSKIELMCLIDRRFNRQFPIMSNYTGMVVDAINEAYVRVDWNEKTKTGEVLLFANKEESQS